jgi:hypothetical protein
MPDLVGPLSEMSVGETGFLSGMEILENTDRRKPLRVTLKSSTMEKSQLTPPLSKDEEAFFIEVSQGSSGKQLFLLQERTGLKSNQQKGFRADSGEKFLAEAVRVCDYSLKSLRW